MIVLKAIGAVLACIVFGLAVGLVLGFAAQAVGAPYGDVTGIIDAWPVYAAIIGAVWWWRRSRKGEQS